MAGKTSTVNVVTAGKLYPSAILVSAQADWTAITVRLASMPVTRMLALGKPGGSLMGRTRPQCRDVKALPA
eukprot:15480475-Alexandrium_andersonii.AAC.1